MDGTELMEKVMAAENRPVLLAGIAIGGIAAYVFMKRSQPGLRRAPRVRTRQRAASEARHVRGVGQDPGDGGGTSAASLQGASGPCLRARRIRGPAARAPPSR